MNKICFDVEKFEEEISGLETEVTELSELCIKGIPNCDNIASLSIDKMISIFNDMEQKMDNYILVLENMIESMKQTKNTFDLVDSMCSDIINA